MAKTLSVVNTSTDTFLNWIVRTNELINALATEILTANSTVGLTTGNAFVNGIFGAATLTANGTLRGGNVTNSSVLTIGSNVVISTGNNLSVGNSTVNTSVSETNVVSANLFASVRVGIGANVYANTSAIFVGNSTVNAVLDSLTLTVNTITGNLITGFTGTYGNGNSSFGGSTLFINPTDDRVSVNTTNSSVNAALIVFGKIYGEGEAQFTQNVTVGGTLIVGNVSMTGTYTPGGNIIPTANGFTLGNTTSVWELYANNASVKNLIIDDLVTEDTINTTTTGTSAQLVDSWLLATYRSADYILSIKNNSANGYQMTKFGILQYDGGINLTEYATLTSNNSLGVFAANANSTAVRLYYTPVPANTTIKGHKTLIGI